jgi:osmoprotectant transport system permease protein
MKTFILVALFAISSIPAQASNTVVIGSKIFTESYILGEIAAQVIENTSTVGVDRKLGMGSTGVLFESLHSGAIDVYPDYSGTLAESILKKPELKSLDKIRSALRAQDLTISESLGFNNTYSLAVREEDAKKYHLKTMSDLAAIASRFKAAFSYEFMDRKDGYLGMVAHYQMHFPPQKVSRMEHSLVYQSIREKAVDVIEVYSTDANIKKFNLHVLQDDRAYFPIYQAVWVATLNFVKNHPAEWLSLRQYEGSISEEKMRSLNAEADIQKVSFAKIASAFLGRDVSNEETRTAQILRRTHEHLALVLVSLIFSLAVGIPLGILAARFQVAGQAILLFSALMQTIPTLALLCFLIPVFGVGTKPALVALCLYSLLPVVLNTFTGIRAVDAKHIENAKAFGLSRRHVLFRVVLPLASPTLLAGVKTATIVSIGTATLAALVGAGGYGALIVSGLSLNNIPMILTGAIPAAVMAVFAHIGFGLLGRILIPAGLRKQH